MICISILIEIIPIITSAFVVENQGPNVFASCCLTSTSRPRKAWMLSGRPWCGRTVPLRHTDWQLSNRASYFTPSGRDEQTKIALWLDSPGAASVSQANDLFVCRSIRIDFVVSATSAAFPRGHPQVSCSDPWVSRNGRFLRQDESIYVCIYIYIQFCHKSPIIVFPAHCIFLLPEVKDEQCSGSPVDLYFHLQVAPGIANISQKKKKKKLTQQSSDSG